MSPVKGRVRVAGLLFYLLQPGALQLWPNVAAAQPGSGLGRVIVIKLGEGEVRKNVVTEEHSYIPYTELKYNASYAV